jgi:SAM-dependent methyltransferase
VCDEIQKKRALSFDLVAESYDLVRPDYPAAAFEQLVTRCDLHSGAHVVEFGAGSGKATAQLLPYGFELTCVEPGPELAKTLRRKFPTTTVVEARFEDFTDRTECFDAIIAAQAFHWFDPATRLQRCHAALRDGGNIALLWNLSPHPQNSFFQELYALYDRCASGLREPSFVDLPPSEIVVSVDSELRNSIYFTDLNLDRFAWRTHYTIDQFLRLLSTYSNHNDLPAAKREALFQEVSELAKRHNNVIEKDYVTVLYTAKRSISA